MTRLEASSKSFNVTATEKCKLTVILLLSFKTGAELQPLFISPERENLKYKKGETGI